MATITSKLRGLILSGDELKALTSWPDAMVEDYLNIIDNLIIIAEGADGNIQDSESLTQQIEQALSQAAKLRAIQSGHLSGIRGRHPAVDIDFDDTVVGGGFTEVQSVLDFFDDQIGAVMAFAEDVQQMAVSW